MTREDVLKLFPDATQEQITQLLNQTHSELSREKSKAESYKAKADEAERYKNELDAINSEKMTELEKATKERDEALAKLTASTTEITKMNQKIALANKGIVGEDADKLVESLAGGNLDIEILAKIISDKENSAKIAKEQEIAQGSSNPNGGNPVDDNGSNGVNPIISNIAKNLVGDGKNTNAIIDNYL